MRKLCAAVALALLAGVSFGATCTYNGAWDTAPTGEADEIVIQSGELTWGTSLPAKVASWSQTGGTVTFDTGLEAFEVTGSVSLLGGTWTHTANPSCVKTSEAWTSGRGTKQLIVSCGGDFVLGEDAQIDVSAKGFTYGEGPGKSSQGASHGGAGVIQSSTYYSTRHISWCYGSVKKPCTLGSGGSSSSYGTVGGGAVRLTVVGSLTLNGTIHADSGTKQSNGTANQYYSGSGGSVWLSASEIVGAGAISVKGGGVTSDGGGGAGRVALYVTGDNKDFTTYTGDVDFSCTAKSLAPFPGTLYRETKADAGKGELWVKGYNATASRIPFYTTDEYKYGTGVCDTDAPVVVKRIRLTGHAQLLVQEGATLVADEIVSENDGTTFKNRIALVGGSLQLPDGYEIKDCIVAILHANSRLLYASEGETVRIGAGADLRLDVPYAVEKDLAIAADGMVSHDTSGTDFSLDLTVPGDCSVAAGGILGANGRGYEKDVGPGHSTTGSSGASHGGRGSGGNDKGDAAPGGNGPCYGSIRKPSTAGSGGKWDGATGGGRVYLSVAGTLDVKGAVSSDAATCGHYSGAGGSVWIKTAKLTGDDGGVISANGGKVTSGQWQAVGGGGRVAVYISGQNNDFTEFAGTISAYGGSKSGYVYGGAGTVYLETAADGETGGRLIVDNGPKAQYKSFECRIAADVTDTEVGSVEIGANTHFKILEGRSLAFSKDWTNEGIFTAEAGSTVVRTANAGTSVLSGTNSFCNFSCVAPGGTLAFDPEGSSFTILSGGSLTLKGEAGNRLKLKSKTDGTAWSMTVDANATTKIEEVTVTDSDASSGALVVANNGTGDANTTNWNFVNVSTGETIFWTGTKSAVWSDPENWDRVRPPAATDYIVITNGCAFSPELGASVTAQALTVGPGAELRLCGNDVTVDTITNLGTVVAGAYERVTVNGDVVMTGSFRPARSTFVQTAGGAFSADGTTFYNVTLTRNGGTLGVTGGFSANRLAVTATEASTVSFEPGRTVSAEEVVLDGLGDGVALLTLTSAEAGAKWGIKAADYASAKGVVVSDSDARGGVTFRTPSPSQDMQGNENWAFGVSTFAWTGAEDAEFTNANNWAGGVAPGADDLVEIVSAATIAMSEPWTVGELRLGGGEEAVTFTGSAALTVKNALEVGANATVTLDAPSAVGGALVIRSGGVVRHSKNASDETYRINLTVGGDITVDEGGVIDAKGCGYGNSRGPGAKVSTWGPSHGGVGGYENLSGHCAPCYGSVFCPTSLGSGGWSAGGGAVRLFAGGTVEVNGRVDVEGADISDHYSGAGGSVWISARKLLGTGTVSANGGFSSSPDSGGGGRIAVYLSQADGWSDELKVTAYGGRTKVSVGSSSPNAAAGTIYVQGQGVEDRCGTIIVRDDNGGSASETVLTDIPARSDGEAASDFKNVTLDVDEGGRVQIFESMTVQELELGSKGRIYLNGKELTIRSLKHRKRNSAKGYDYTGTVSTGAGGAIRFLPRGLMLIVR